MLDLVHYDIINLMKKPVILIVAIWAFTFILLPHSAEAEMSALTDEQMAEARINNWNLSLTLTVDVDLESERDDPLTDTEEFRLNTHLSESIEPFDEEQFEIFKRKIERTIPYDFTSKLDMEAQFKPGTVYVNKH